MRMINHGLVANRVLEIIDTNRADNSSEAINLSLNKLAILSNLAYSRFGMSDVNKATDQVVKVVDDLMTALVVEAYAVGNKTIPGTADYDMRRTKLISDVYKTFTLAIEKIPYARQYYAAANLDPVIALIDDATDQYRKVKEPSYDAAMNCLSQVICALTISRLSYWKETDFFGECITEY